MYFFLKQWTHSTYLWIIIWLNNGIFGFKIYHSIVIITLDIVSKDQFMHMTQTK